MMNDATLRQMAAAKTTVNNENHMLRASSAGFILPSAARLRLSIRGLCAASSAISASKVRTPRHGCRWHQRRTQVNFRCYCACRRHQRCQLEEAETSVRLRFMGSSRTSYSLSLSTIWGAGPKAQWLVEKILIAEHFLAVGRHGAMRPRRRREGDRVAARRMIVFAVADDGEVSSRASLRVF